MARKEELVRYRLDDASRRVQSTVEARAKISRRRSETTAARGVGLLQGGSEANDEGASLSQRRASLGNNGDGMPSLSADQLLQGRLIEARARIKTKVHEASITNDDPKSSSSSIPTMSKAKATRRSSLPKVLQQHLANDSLASVAKSYAASPRDNNVHLFDTDVDLLPSAPIWSSHSGSATSRTAQQSRSYWSSDESLSISGLGDSMLLEEVAKELALSAPRHDSSGEIVITTGGNRKFSGEYPDDFHDDGDHDDDSLQGSITMTVPLLDANRVDGEDGLHMLMQKFSM